MIYKDPTYKLNYKHKYEGLSFMLGATINEIVRHDPKHQDDQLTFVTDRGTFIMQHFQDCCECVEIKEIAGDLADLIGSPLLLAEKVSSEDETPMGMEEPKGEESFTWTFYKFATVKGHVTITWFGSSNGYYSEGVDVSFIPLEGTLQ